MKIALRLFGFALVMVFLLAFLATSVLTIVSMVEVVSNYWILTPFMTGVVREVFILLATAVGIFIAWRGYRLVGRWTRTRDKEIISEEAIHEKAGTKDPSNQGVIKQGSKTNN